ncbi:LacI family DNA-binding transcriptional regulator [Butyrivibrio sp. WCD3002]|uniref:LacI family DNA-binding transcriptional regulator n=1 Tax=Butyrivibrio sp. WCD3002 TaxID=1280676 RepID=UPI000400E830|nr:LacI family DNA-binding transcriptional regulator [Butyrivibrio sp. WCD3002]
MVTIKDIAKYTELSPSTVSIVLRGLGKKRNISESSIKKVQEAAVKLGYTPNMQSKLLRSNLPNMPVITIFWDASARQDTLSRFLSGLQSSIIKHGYKYGLNINPYNTSHLKEAITQRTLTSSNGIIICNASENDMEYLDSNDFPIPIVLYNRYSEKYPTVNMDDNEIGVIPAEVFARHEKKHPCILGSVATFNGMHIRENVFRFKMNEFGITDIGKIEVQDSLAGGYMGALEISKKKELPDCVLCTSDNIAFGALKGFFENGIKIPEDLELISIGNGLKDHEEYAIPSLSVVGLPIEEMADACLTRVARAITEFDLTPDRQQFHVEYISRKSSPV